MFPRHLIGLLTNPRAEWRLIRDRDYGIGSCLGGHMLLLALIPAVSGFIGTTRIGWRIGAGDPVMLTTASAAPITVFYYLAMIAAAISVGWVIHWMSRTYGARPSFAQCLVLASYTATPLFIIGIMQLYPVLWLNMIIGLFALALTIRIFFAGVPIMMDVPEERAFLFASAVMAFGLVTLVAMLAVTVLLWGAGFAPVFTR